MWGPKIKTFSVPETRSAFCAQCRVFASETATAFWLQNHARFCCDFVCGAMFFCCARNAQTIEALPQITIASAFLGSERRRIKSVGLRYGAWVIGVLHPVAMATRTTSVHVCRAKIPQRVWWNAWCYRCSPLAYIQWRMQASCKRGRAVARCARLLQWRIISDATELAFSKLFARAGYAYDHWAHACGSAGSRPR